jgi:hypothetical protein
MHGVTRCTGDSNTMKMSMRKIITSKHVTTFENSNNDTDENYEKLLFSEN